MKDLNYPDIEQVGAKRVRRWLVETIETGPIDSDLAMVGTLCTNAIELARRSAYHSTGRDLNLLRPSVTIRRNGPRTLSVEIEYHPEGTVGDCEMIALWVPIRLIDSIWRVHALQGVERARWRVLF
jgi:hypothetical protein